MNIKANSLSAKDMCVLSGMTVDGKDISAYISAHAGSFADARYTGEAIGLKADTSSVYSKAESDHVLERKLDKAGGTVEAVFRSDSSVIPVADHLESAQTRRAIVEDNCCLGLKFFR